MCTADCFLNFENTQNIDGDIELCCERSKTVKFIRNTLYTQAGALLPHLSTG